MLLRVFSRISFIMLVLLLAGDRLLPFVDAAQRFVMNTITTSYIIIIILVVGASSEDDDEKEQPHSVTNR